ncbi:hypothetical protein DSCO28_26430 [Desulfosarcina ovata subsp. sediminis]|uniref:DEAD box helicase DbpA/CsdA RNA-binding domain-containing protein n=1 Tax=Desulfosarcina ovata subsp. sediminis TaxID=885957 RepID=A0A5K7ZNW2_9BACT|nr:DbpA RNA binding domain-containing protein [Desulfosarcina ovata]BBO82077.1 hypothetical protein DSCO28_26430 [Desulfosarcina ovata subsp. sediminis]
MERIVNPPVNRNAFADHLPAVREALAELDRDELILRVMAAGVGRLLEDYRRTDSIDAGSRPSARKRPAGKPATHRPRVAEARRFFINVGRLDKINAGAIVRLMCDHTGIRSNQIGRIELKREFSFFEVARGAANNIPQRLKNIRLDGRQVQVKDAGGKKQEARKTGQAI